jgi:hypothetical protein
MEGQAMNPESQRVRDLFVAAFQLPPERWDAFLEEACSGDEELRHQVSDLLREHQPAAQVQATGNFDATADAVAAAAPEEGPGTTIGPYKLLACAATCWPNCPRRNGRPGNSCGRTSRRP